jgi:hypothetical protein
VKENQRSAKAKKKQAPSSSSLFLNITILILSVTILYLGYSILDKLYIFESPLEKDISIKHAKNIQVEVLNGCGVSDIADNFTDRLRKKNFDVVNTTNYRSFEIDNSIVIDRSGNMPNAEYLAEIIGLDKTHVIQQKNKNYFLDVTFIVGKDFKNLFQNN